MKVVDDEEIKEKFAVLHSYDSEHLSAIFSQENKLIIEAPAGSGKTKILISKIAYNLAIGSVASNKKILALTFGVNAAYKIKKDIATKLPELTANYNTNPSLLNSKITVTNFHGFARRVLKKYGQLLDPKLKEIETLESVSDNSMEGLNKLDLGLNREKLEWITNLYEDIKLNRKNFKSNQTEFLHYLDLVKTYFLPKNKIPFNAYLIFLLQLFSEYKELKDFYCKLYPIIIVDEFQDTNILSWEIINMLIIKSTKVWLLGDSLQRIYGFIGAIENLMDIAEHALSMKKIELHTNYRFKDNPELLRLDKNIRECARNIAYPKPDSDANVNTFLFDNLEEENKWTIDSVSRFLQSNDGKLAILIKQRSPDIANLVEELNKENVNFFYAIFSDDDLDYIKFHKISLEIFLEELKEKKPKSISKQFLEGYYNKIKNKYQKRTLTENSLLILLSAFIQNLLSEYKFLERDEKVSYIVDILTNRSLKQCMEYIDSRIILSTVHGAKGLEWDNIIIRGMKDFSFPSFDLCRNCRKCRIENECCLNTGLLAQDENLKKKYLEELSVFYVAATRAKKTLCMTTNFERINNQGVSYPSQLSCFLRLPGIIPNLI